MDRGTVLKKHSLRRRLLTAYAAVLALFIVLFGAALVWGLNNSLDSKLRISLESVIYDIKQDVLPNPLSSELLDPEEEFAVYPVYIEVLQLTEGEKRRVLYSENLANRHLPLPSEHAVTFESVKIEFISDVDKSAVLSMPVTVQGETYIISAATPIDKIDDTMEDFLKIAALSGMLLYLAALYLGYRMIDRVFSPMQSITHTAASISKNSLSGRVPLPENKDEFYTLAETFNTMLERIEKSFGQIRRFNANVSHELKTPLTIIRGEAELALRKEREPKEYRQFLQSIVDETVSMQTIVENMLLLSKSDIQTLKKQMAPVALNDLLMEVCKEKKHDADAKGVDLSITQIEPVTILGEATLLKEALSNLIDNAIKYTPEAKHVEISLKKDGDDAEIIIKDEGAGIEKEALQKVFDPFWREDSAHTKTIPGHGLGLSIAQWIVWAHEGRIAIESEKNNGTTCLLQFIQPGKKEGDQTVNDDSNTSRPPLKSDD